MAAVYYEKIDVEGHHFGPDSQQVRTAVQHLDLIMQILNRKIKVRLQLFFHHKTFLHFLSTCFMCLLLQETNMAKQLNVMMFSDHGMTKIQWMEKVIELDQYVHMSDISKMMDRGPVVSLWPKNNTFQQVTHRICSYPFVYTLQNGRVMVHLHPANNF